VLYFFLTLGNKRVYGFKYVSQKVVYVTKLRVFIRFFTFHSRTG